MFGPAGTFQSPKAKVQASNEILMVELIAKSGGEWYARCPHCRRIVGLGDESVRGEQFTDRDCGGMLEVSSMARSISAAVFFNENQEEIAS